MAGAASTHPPGDAGGRRTSLAHRIKDWLDAPMAILAVVWVVVMLQELVDASLGKRRPALTTAGVVLWIVFFLEFLFELLIAPDWRAFLRKNWLTALSVALPFLSVMRVFRALAALRGLMFAR